jgi:hypothetical protein
VSSPYIEPRYDPPKSTRQQIAELTVKLHRATSAEDRARIEDTIYTLCEQDAVDRGERQ